MLPDPRYEAKYSEGHRKSYRSDLDPDDLAHMLESSRSRPTDLRYFFEFAIAVRCYRVF